MRKEKSVKNFLTSIIPFFILAVLGFWRLQVLLNGLGEEIYALNQVFIQLFSYISLLEAGVGTLITQLYYKFFITNDHKSINDVYFTSKKTLRKISIIMMIVGFCISFFLKILTKNNLSLLYMQFVFMLYLFRSVLEYLMFSPRFVLSADQKVYKINIVLNIFKILEIIVEILILQFYKNYIVILLSSIVLRYVSYYLANRKVFKEYPWLKTDKNNKTVPIKEMKGVIAHKLAGTIFSNTDILLVSSFLKPISVVIYSSYNYIIKFISDGIYMLAASITASMGNVLHKENENDQHKIFEKTNYVFIFFAMFFSIALFYTTNKFIDLWIGKDKVIDGVAFSFMIATLYISTVVRPFLIVRDVKALYTKTRKIAILEAVINIILSILLIRKFQITGVVFATVVASIISSILYIKYIYKNVFGVKTKKYFVDILISIVITVVICLMSKSINIITNSNNYISWFINSILFVIVVGFILFVLNYVLFSNFRLFIKEIIGNKINIKRLINIVFGLFKVNNKKIMFQCGRDMVDGNPKALYDYILENNANDYKLIWIVSKKTDVTGLRSGDFVYSKTIKSLYHLATSKYWIRSESIGSVLNKKKNQIYIQTWHGHGAMKKMGYDITNEKERPIVEHAKEWDYLLANDSLDEKILKSSTGYNKETLVIGTPCTDSILKKNKNLEFKSNLLIKLGIKDKSKKIVLYAPTFREKDLESSSVNLHIDKLKKLKDCIILVRLHPLINSKLNATDLGNNMINVCNYPDSSDLMLISDILITDYSSIVYEYSILNKLSIFYAYDYLDYEKERGFDLNYKEELPGPIVYNEKELYDVLIESDKYQKKYQKKLKEFNRIYNYKNDGTVCEKFFKLFNENYFK